MLCFQHANNTYFRNSSRRGNSLYFPTLFSKSDTVTRVALGWHDPAHFSSVSKQLKAYISRPRNTVAMSIFIMWGKFSMYPASYTMDTGGSYRAGKATGVWNWPLTPI